MEKLTNMTWREKLESLKSELDALKKKAMDLTGIDLEKLEAYDKQPPIEECMKSTKNKFLKVYPVITEGTRCLILSSCLYPEVGLLIFDAPELGIGTGGKISIIGSQAKFNMICGCCAFWAEGIGNWKEQENLKESFLLAVRTSCKEHGVTNLIFRNSPSRAHALDGLRLGEGIDRWQFAAAFSEIEIHGEGLPFENFFKK